MDSNGGPSAGSPSELDSLPAGYTFFDRVLLTSMRRTDQFILGFSGQRRGEQYVLCVMVTDMGRRGWAAEVDIRDLEQWFKDRGPTPSPLSQLLDWLELAFARDRGRLVEGPGGGGSGSPSPYLHLEAALQRDKRRALTLRLPLEGCLQPLGEEELQRRCYWAMVSQLASCRVLANRLEQLEQQRLTEASTSTSEVVQLRGQVAALTEQNKTTRVNANLHDRRTVDRGVPAPAQRVAQAAATARSTQPLGSPQTSTSRRASASGSAASALLRRQAPISMVDPAHQPLLPAPEVPGASTVTTAELRAELARATATAEQSLTLAPAQQPPLQAAAELALPSTAHARSIHQRDATAVPATSQAASASGLALSGRVPSSQCVVSAGNAMTGRKAQPVTARAAATSRAAARDQDSSAAASAAGGTQQAEAMMAAATSSPPAAVSAAGQLEARGVGGAAAAAAAAAAARLPAASRPGGSGGAVAAPTGAPGPGVSRPLLPAPDIAAPGLGIGRTLGSQAGAGATAGEGEGEGEREGENGGGPGARPVLEVLVQDAPAASHALDALDPAPAGPAAPAAPDMEPHRSALDAVHAGDPPGLAAAAGGGEQPRASLTVQPAGLGPADPCLPKPSAAGEVPASRSEGKPLQACGALNGSQPRVSLGAAAATLTGAVDAHQPQACSSQVARPEAVGGAAAHDRSSPSAPPLPAPTESNPRAVTVDSCVPAAPQPLRPNASLPRNAALQSSPVGAGDGAALEPALEMRRPRGSPLTLAEAFGVEEWPGTSRCAASGVRGPGIAAGTPGGGAGAGGGGGAGTRGAAVGCQGSHDKATPGGGHVGALAKAAAGISTPGSATCTQQQQQHQQQQHAPQSLRKRLFVEMDLTQGYCPAQRKSGRLAGPQLTQEPARGPGQPAVTPVLPAPATGAVPHDPLDSVLAEPQRHVPAAASPHVLTAPAVAAAPAASVTATAAQAAALPAASGAEAGLVRPGTAAGIQTGNLPVTAVPCRVAPGLPRTFVDAMLDEIGGEPPPLPTLSGVTAQRPALSARHAPGTGRLGLSLGDASGANVLRAVAESPPWSLPARALAPGVGWPGPDTQGHPQPAQVKSSSTVAISACNSTGVEVTQRLGGAPSRG